MPTPAIGGVGVLEDVSKMATIGFKNEGDEIWLFGNHGTDLGQSLWLQELHGREDGDPPCVDLKGERSRGEDVRWFVETGKANAVHDISDGGLLVALAEMALAGELGVHLDIELDALRAFAEDQGRYILTASDGEFLENAVPIGHVGGSKVAGIELADLRAAHESFFKDWMEG